MTAPWTFTSHTVVLPRENIDTDQIIPARFLTTTRRDGLGPHAFHDWRYLEDGALNPDFPLNLPDAANAQVLIAGNNFGCGSSREHAVWALKGVGLRAVISSAFADIFRGNALGNGLLPIEVSPSILDRLIAQPRGSVAIDLEHCTLTLPDGESVRFPISPFARHCLLNGIDEMQFILDADDDVRAFESRAAQRIDTTQAMDVA